MRKKFISLVVATGMITGIGVVGATGAQAETRSTGSTTFTSPIVAKPVEVAVYGTEWICTMVYQ